MKKKGLFFGMIAVLIVATFGFIGCEESSDPQSDAKDVIAFSINGTDGVIEETAISVTLPAETPINALTPAVEVSAKAQIINPSDGTAIDLTTAVDFTKGGKNYVVKAENGSTKVYHVEVIVTPADAKSSAKDIIAFSIGEADGVIDETANRIYVTLPAGTAVTALTPAVVVSAEAEVINPSDGTAIDLTASVDFTSEKNYVVKAEDGTTKVYHVEVIAPEVSKSSAKSIVAFSIGEAEGTIDEEAKSITVALPAGTARTALVAVAVVSAKAHIIDPSTGLDIGEKDADNDDVDTLPEADFTDRKNYVVKAEDGSVQVYRVIVTAPPAPDARTLELTIGLISPEGEPVVYGAPADGIVLSRYGVTEDTPYEVVISIDKNEWNSIAWYIDGIEYSNSYSNNNIITIKANGYNNYYSGDVYFTLEQPHKITFVGTKDGVQYSKTIGFTVVK
jgi:hypothetical protein